MFKRFFLLTILSVAFFIACSESDDLETSQNDNFDRASMQTNLADNIIIPAYQDMNQELGLLVSAKENFILNSNQENLEQLRNNFLESYLVWQSIEMFNIGKAEEIFYHYQMNIYPANINDIQNNTTLGNADLSHPNNNDAVGFPALDYMLYGLGGNVTEILEIYNNQDNGQDYKNYLSSLIDQMKSMTEMVLNDWTTSYRNNFITGTENSATSAVNKFVNDFIYYYEKGLRANKIGIPAGNFSSTPLPHTVEGYYAREISKNLTLEALDAFQNLFNGKHYNSNNNGVSFKDYLNYLERNDLVNLINDRLDEARNKISDLDDNYFDQINSDNTKMTQAYDALQTVVVLVKVDMLQAFNISVDYVDADGD